MTTAWDLLGDKQHNTVLRSDPQVEFIAMRFSCEEEGKQKKNNKNGIIFLLPLSFSFLFLFLSLFLILIKSNLGSFEFKSF